MPAFERIDSGFAGLDRTLDSIRLGDNVVWQVGSVEDYRALVQPFARQALADGRALHYIRFAPHAPLLEAQAGLQIHVVDPAQGFERFSGEVHHLITAAGLDAFYVFDCLSELQTAWAADLMMGNFFKVTCPYLFELDTVAWFCLLRHRHSYDTIARIRETTQLMLDLYRDEDWFYVHPLKVWQRFSPTMFFPHRLRLDEPERIESITDSVAVSHFYQLVGAQAPLGDSQQLDSWERFFIAARQAGEHDETMLSALAERLLGSEPRMLALVLANTRLSDLLGVKDRLIGSGKIGGKACGMLLSRWIVRRRLPALAATLEPHDSWYLGADVFYTYLIHNGLWKLRMQQGTPAGYFSQAPALQEGIRGGRFPEAIRAQFVRLLEYFGQAPIIVRSSSLLEDSFGHAFAGKYESVFCTNSGSPEDRLRAFEDAVRQVFASTMDESALTYRRQRGLDQLDEQMAILIQRVSGSPCGDFFMPAAAGVGYSRSAWRWHRDLDPAAGMLRAVAGLGTRAVDRTGNDYPRLISLDKPHLEAHGGVQRGRYTQHALDGLDLSRAALATRPLEAVLPLLPPWLAARLAARDDETEASLAERGILKPVWRCTLPGLVDAPPLLDALGRMLHTIADEYASPVDIEFTVNWGQQGEFMINLLQCRPLKIHDEERNGPQLDAARLAQIAPADLFFHLQRDCMGPALATPVSAVILIDPRAYYELPYRLKPGVARCVGKLNALLANETGAVMLLAPGRIGTSSPELGVPVSFAEISNIRILCEIAHSETGYQPELSFGSHFFQDLVEADIYYGAISEDPAQASFNPAFFASEADCLAQLLPDHGLPDGLIRVYRPTQLMFQSDLQAGCCLCANAEAQACENSASIPQDTPPCNTSSPSPSTRSIA